MSIPEYDEWLADPTPERLSTIVSALEPTINSEVYRYTGPKPLLRSKAKSLSVKAIKSFDPTRGANLRSWVVTQLQPLSRYGQKLRPVHASEAAIRQAAELDRVQRELTDEMEREPTVEELSDHIGISPKRIKKLRESIKPSLTEGALTESTDEQVGALPGVIEPDRLNLAEEVIYESLTQRDRQIYDWKAGRHGKAQLPNHVIAKRLGVTPALVSQRSSQIAQQIRSVYDRGLV